MKKSLFIFLMAIFTFFLMGKYLINNLEYIEPANELKGEWLELSSISRAFNSIAHGNDVFVAVGEGIVAYSPNGRDWVYTENESIGIINDITFANGRFVAVGNDKIYSSINGLTWTETDIGKDNNLFSVAYGNGAFIAVGSVGVFSSIDGITWEHDRNNLYWTTFWSVCFGNNKFVAVGPYSVASSNDGQTWVSNDIPFKNGMGYLTSVAYSKGKFIALGGLDDNGSMIWSSNNGQNWDTVAKVHGSGFKGNIIDDQFFFAGNSGLLYSSNGNEWLLKSLPPDKNLYDIVKGNNKLIAVGLLGWDGNSPVPSAPIMLIDINDF